MGCSFCNKDWVQGCWDAKEAANCGNLDREAVERAKSLAKAATEAQEIRDRQSRRLTKAEIEKAERNELARLKAKYET